MNGDDLNLEEFQPSFLEDGGGISAGQGKFPPFEEDRFDWEADASTIDLPDQDDIASSGGCLADAGDPPDMGTYVLGSVDGTCQWIDTTTCP